MITGKPAASSCRNIDQFPTGIRLGVEIRLISDIVDQLYGRNVAIFVIRSNHRSDIELIHFDTVIIEHQRQISRPTVVEFLGNDGDIFQTNETGKSRWIWCWSI
jgi:hypothetical protein